MKYVIELEKVFKVACSENALYQKFETNIPRNETAQARSEFPHSCICERFIFIFPRSVHLFFGRYLHSCNTKITKKFEPQIQENAFLIMCINISNYWCSWDWHLFLNVMLRALLRIRVELCLFYLYSQLSETHKCSFVDEQVDPPISSNVSNFF